MKHNRNGVVPTLWRRDAADTKYNKKESQIILRYLIQKNIVVIPRSTNPEHIKENFNVFDFKLDDEDMNTLESLDKKKRVSGWPESMKIEEIY